LTTTAALAWRAISPVSMLRVWGPYWNDFLNTDTRVTSRMKGGYEKAAPM
jgi:hypothetical protein